MQKEPAAVYFLTDPTQCAVSALGYALTRAETLGSASENAGGASKRQRASPAAGAAGGAGAAHLGTQPTATARPPMVSPSTRTAVTHLGAALPARSRSSAEPAVPPAELRGAGVGRRAAGAPLAQRGLRLSHPTSSCVE